MEVNRAYVNTKLMTLACKDCVINAKILIEWKMQVPKILSKWIVIIKITDDDNDVRKIYLTIIGKGYSYRIKA